MTETQLKKIEFVDDLNKVIKKHISNIDKIEYDVLPQGYEFLVVNYIGGAKSVRCCTGNSNSAIFRELGKLLDNGYYDELDFYEQVKNRG